MADVLQEFLVSVRYAVDSASQQNFLSTLKQMQGRIGVVVAEVAALGVAIGKLAEHFAKAGEQFYFMAQRLGSSVTDIQAATEAMTDLGASTEEARGSMEALGRFSRSYGPIATQFLAQMGVTAQGTEGRMRQLGERLRSMIASGPMGYPMAMRWAQMLGIDEMTMRAITSPEYGQRLDVAHGIQRQAFGIGAGPQADAQRQAALDRMAAQAHQMMNLMRQFGFAFSAVMSVFSAKLFTALQPQFEALFKTLMGWLPSINRALGFFAEVLGIVVAGVNDFVEGLDWLAKVLEPVIGHISGLDIALGGLAAAFLATPFGMFVGGFVLLLGILDDFRAYMQGAKHLLNWEALAGFFKQVNDWIDGWSTSIEEFFKKWLGFDPGMNSKFGDAVKQLNDFVREWTGFDFSKSGDFVRFFEKWGEWLNPIKQANEAWAALVKAFGDIAALLGGESGRAGLIKLMGDLMDAMNPIAWIKNAWKETADAIARITGSASPSSGDGGGRNLGDLWREYMGGGTGGGGGGGGAPGTPVTGTQAQIGIRDQLLQTFARYGEPISTGSANAMMASFFAESGLDPSSTSDTGAHGLPNWVRSRFAPLSAWARSTGLDPESREGQMAMVVHEIQTNPAFRYMLQQMEATTDPAKKRELFTKMFEAGVGAGAPLGTGIFTPGYLQSHSRLQLPEAAPLTHGAVPPAAPQGGDTSNVGPVSMNHSTTIHISGAGDPHLLARNLGDQQERIAMNTVRLAKSVLV